MFRLCAAVQGVQRIGLTATLIREDGAETDVFSLIGPKRYEAPWREIEKEGFLAAVQTFEISVPLAKEDRIQYLEAPARLKHRVAALNNRKLELIRKLLLQHLGGRVLIIGNYIHQLQKVARELQAPLI